jgi:uncharacterized protein YlxW (UPF0749 family)
MKKGLFAIFGAFAAAVIVLLANFVVIPNAFAEMPPGHGGAHQDKMQHIRQDIQQSREKLQADRAELKGKIEQAKSLHQEVKQERMEHREAMKQKHQEMKHKREEHRSGSHGASGDADTPVSGSE